MAPTICTEKEARVRSIRESRKRLQHSSSSSSVISYVGKITHRRSVAIRTATSKITAHRSLESESTEDDDDDDESEVEHNNRCEQEVPISPPVYDTLTDNEDNQSQSTSSENMDTTTNCDMITSYNNVGSENSINEIICRCSNTIKEIDASKYNYKKCCRQLYTTDGVIVRIDQKIINHHHHHHHYHNMEDSTISSAISSIWNDDRSQNSIDFNNISQYKHHHQPITKSIFNKKSLAAAPPQPQNTKGLLDIAVKTIKLIKRNQLLQRKLSQLQYETRAFIESVLSNPENQELREKIQKSKSIET